MEISEVRIFIKEGQDKKLKAYATVTFDNCFVVRNIKVIQGQSSLFIAMPSRKIKFNCSKCHFKNEAGCLYCGHCGEKLETQSSAPEQRDAKTEHRDIAHPVTQDFREYIQKEILSAYDKEAGKS